MSTETILLVDDEELERIYLKQAIEKKTNKFRVIGEAGNGREAMELAFKLLPSYVLMDIRMPGINGLDAIKEIKSLHPEIACIIITAYEEFSYAQKALRIGAEDYLLKPVSPEEILSVIDVLQKQNKIIYNKSSLGKNSGFDKYPLAKEKLIILALKNRDLRLFSIAFEEFTQELIKFTGMITPLQTFILEFNTVVTRQLLDSDVDIKKLSLNARDKIQDILALSSLDEAKNYLRNYKSEIIELMNNELPGNKDLVENILKYIKRNISRNNMCLDELAHYFHFSPSYISRSIKKETGLTFSEHLNEIRIAEAKILLSNSEININQIAFLAGYNEVPHFNRMFKRITGISPSKYRNLFS